MTQRTAVEWLDKQLKDTYDKEGKLPLAYTLDLVKQAKQMEREQIIRARQDGLDNGFSNGSWDSNLYYNETYNK